MVVNVKIVTLISGDLAVESHEQWLENTLAALQVEVHGHHPVEKGQEGILSDPVQVGFFIDIEIRYYLCGLRKRAIPVPPRIRWPIF